MPQLQRSVAALRIGGDALVPEEITTLLGAPPSHSYRKGEKFGESSPRSLRKSGQWSLQATDCIPENVGGQITEILGKLTDDPAVWASLGASYQIDLFCGWFMDGRDEGLDISSENLMALGTRGIKLSVCIYAPSED